MGRLAWKSNFHESLSTQCSASQVHVYDGVVSGKLASFGNWLKGRKQRGAVKNLKGC